MATNKYRGVEASQELDTNLLRPDTRRLGVKARQFFQTTDGVIAAMIAFPVLALLLIKLPFSGEVLILCMWFFYSLYVDPGHTDQKRKGGKIRKYDFPYRVPLHGKVFDGSNPGSRLGSGITYLGKETSSKLEIWSGDSDLRTHHLVLGTTGSGKTEFLLGLVYNALVQNSGFIYTDGKGDVALFNNVFRLARYLGREGDLVTVNFLTSGRDFLDKQKDRTTNTMNPFALGSSGMLIELIISLMDDSGGGGDMWKGRAIAFVAGQTRALCFLRDHGYILLDSNKFIEYFELPVIEKMVWDKTITEGGADIKIEDPLFDKVLEPLKAYILTLPGYRREAKGAQEQKTVEQHGFITMQLTRLFGDMSFTYGYLFQTSLGEVDMYDVVINRRILVVLLPALERAPDSLKMLGKLIVGSIKQMMAGCLGNRLEGAVREIVDARPTNASVPFYVVLDEYGYYAVLGFAVAPAQARSLGFSITFAAQDFSSLQKASKEEADATWENTNVRVVGRITSGKESETFRRIVGVSGEAKVHEMNRKEFESGAVMDGYRTVRDTGVTAAQRVEYDDLAQQENGEFTFLIGKKNKSGLGGVRVIRARTFFTQVDERPREIRVNHFLKVEPPRSIGMDQEVAIVDALEQAVTEMLAAGKLRDLFPDDEESMVRNKQPATLLQLSGYLREAQKSQKLSLSEAVRVALVCTDREADAQQATMLKRIEERKRAEIEAGEGADEPGVSQLVAEAPVGLDVNDIPEIGEPDLADDAIISASADGMPMSISLNLDGDADDDDDESGTSGAGDAGAAGSGAATGSSAGGSGGGMGVSLLPDPLAKIPDEAADVAEADAARRRAEVAASGGLGLAIRNYIDEYDEEGGESAGEGGGARVSEPKAISLLTLAPMGEGEDTAVASKEAMAIENKIAEADIALGLKMDLQEIRSDAKNERQKLEAATTYVDGATPEPATADGFSAQINQLAMLLESSDVDYLT